MSEAVIETWCPTGVQTGGRDAGDGEQVLPHLIFPFVQ